MNASQVSWYQPSAELARIPALSRIIMIGIDVPQRMCAPILLRWQHACIEENIIFAAPEKKDRQQRPNLVVICADTCICCAHCARRSGGVRGVYMYMSTCIDHRNFRNDQISAKRPNFGQTYIPGPQIAFKPQTQRQIMLPISLQTLKKAQRVEATCLGWSGSVCIQQSHPAFPLFLTPLTLVASGFFLSEQHLPFPIRGNSGK
jgi:hypothetical protein